MDRLKFKDMENNLEHTITTLTHKVVCTDDYFYVISGIEFSRCKGKTTFHAHVIVIRDSDKRRCLVTMSVSNKAVENADFDLRHFVERNINMGINSILKRQKTKIQ